MRLKILLLIERQRRTINIHMVLNSINYTEVCVGKAVVI